MTELAALLHKLTPADALEAGYLTRMQALMKVEGDPFSRKHFLPGHFTASSFVISPKRDAMLLIHHRALGLWLQPGGHFEPGDASVLDAARRELVEETGLADLPLAVDGLLDVDIHDLPPIKDEPAHAHFDLRFAFQAQSLETDASDEVAGCKWFPFEGIGLTFSDASVMRAVEKLRALG